MLRTLLKLLITISINGKSLPPFREIFPILILLTTTIPAGVSFSSYTLLGVSTDERNIGLLYNLYADTELQLGLVPQKVYDQQSAWYPTVFDTYGVPLDTRHTETKCTYTLVIVFLPTLSIEVCVLTKLTADWECFAASIASSATRAKFYSAIAKWINSTPTNRPLTDLYDAITGE